MQIGLGIGAVSDIILVIGTMKNQTWAIYLWCIVNFFDGICLYPLVQQNLQLRKLINYLDKMLLKKSEEALHFS